METNMKTPISYYGGKQKMLQHILPKIPSHILYVEPFFGGGAVFFAKPASDAEIINDINNRLITFYRALKYDFDDLSALVDESFHSRAQHKISGLAYEAGKEQIESPLEMAHAVWMQTNMSFATQIGAASGMTVVGSVRSSSTTKKIISRKRTSNE